MLSLLSLLDGLALWWFAPALGELRRNGAAPHDWVARVGADGAIGTAAGALLWLVALWLAVGLSTTLIAASTGRRHGPLVALSRRLTPALLRRLVIASTGASIALSPITALAMDGGAAPAIASGSIAIGWPSDPATVALATPSWPLDQMTDATGTTGTTGHQPSPGDSSPSGLPAGPTPVGQPSPTRSAPSTGGAVTPPWSSSGGTVATAGATTGTPTTGIATGPAGTTSPPPVAGTTPGPPLDPNPDRPAPGTVVVKPGDSLWLLTAQRLGPTATDSQIAVGWPSWYRQNRPIIGRDPNLLRPGQRLTVPTAEGTS